MHFSFSSQLFFAVTDIKKVITVPELLADRKPYELHGSVKVLDHQSISP